MDLNKDSSFPKIDKDHMIGHIIDFPVQCEKAFEDMKSFALPTPYVKVKNVVVLGMGGSAIGGDLAKSLAQNTSNIPIYVLRDYQLPAFVNSDSLVIGSSYSGQTEETLSAFQQAGEKGAKLVVISTGGTISSIGRKYKAPIYQIDYGSQPRAALGFSFIPTLAIFKKIGLVDLSDEDIKESILLLKGFERKLRSEIPIDDNLAKQIALKIFNKIPLIYGSGTLTEVARRWKTQINENAKTSAYYETIPELCHNSVVGFDLPANLKDEVFVIILQSKFDHPRNKLRQSVIISLLEKKQISYHVIDLHQSSSAFSEMLLSITLGDYASYYLAMLNNIDPTPVDVIGFLKDQLSASR